jgi:tachykinin-like receptor
MEGQDFAEGNWSEWATLVSSDGNDTTYNDHLLLNASSMAVNSTNNGSGVTSAMPVRNEFILPIWEQALWACLFAVMVVVATGGNLIVIWIVLAHKRMRTVTNYFIVNLSVADTMVSTLNVIFSFSYLINSHWPFGYTYCKICSFVAMLSVSGSVFTLMAISLDRLVIKPYKKRKANIQMSQIICIIEIK